MTGNYLQELKLYLEALEKRLGVLEKQKKTITQPEKRWQDVPFYPLMKISNLLGQPNFPDQTFISVYLNSAQTIGTASWTKIGFDTELSDTQSEFDTSTNLFTAKTKGVFLLAGHAQWSATVDTKEYHLRFDKNGAPGAGVNQGDFIFTSPGTANMSCAGTALVSLVNGDTIQTSVYHDSGGDKNLGNGVGGTFLNIFKIA